MFLCVAFLLLAAVLDHHAAGLIIEDCSEALGMESGAIPDRDVTASSAYDASSVGPHHARLKKDKSGGAWCPRHMVTRESREWLEIDLHSLHTITGTRTQGRYGNGQGQEYVEQFMLEYWRPGFQHWQRWKGRHMEEMLQGNTNTYSIEEQRVHPPIRASKIRFVPYSDHVRTVCMRTELLGCPAKGGLVSYRMRQGYLGEDMDLRDTSYDGVDEGGMLWGGLGQLVDGQIGPDNFRLQHASSGRGRNAWIGWRRDAMGRPVEIVFEFDAVRNFSAMNIHTNNMFSKDVQVFSKAEIVVSVGGRQFAPVPVSFSYMPDLVMEKARNVTVKLHGRVGRFIRLHLYFPATYLLISEVTFESTVAVGNFTEEEDEEENGIPVHPEHSLSKEFSIQRDDVQNTADRNDDPVTRVSSHDRSAESSDRGYIGPVIGALATVIVILVAAILFMVVRNRRLRAAAAGHANGFAAVSQKPIKMAGGLYGQVCVEEPEEKPVIYHEPFNTKMNMYSGVPVDRKSHSLAAEISRPKLSSKVVPDVLKESDYAVPHVGGPSPVASPPRSPLRPLPSLQDFLPKPPPIPPPDSYTPPREPCRVTGDSPSGTSVQLSRLLTNMTDSEMLPTDTETECEDEELPLISRDQLTMIDLLGYGQFGEVHICELAGTNQLVAVKMLSSDSNDAVVSAFRREARVLHRIQDENIVKVLGADLCGDSPHLVLEMTRLGDLNAFLQDHIADTASPIPCNAKILSYGCLIYMATQIASGMKYLESIQFVHRDLAARNCLVSEGYRIRISDLGTCRAQYANDYVTLDQPPALPIRWMPWESALVGKFSSKADVWAFAVTMWEVLTFAREQPFEDLTDKEVLHNLTDYLHASGSYLLLERPKNCPKEIYDLMRECWQRNEDDRPSFREIHLFLQRKNLGYRPPVDSTPIISHHHVVR